MELERVKNLVTMTLRENPSTRESDEILYLEVCRKVNEKALYLPFAEVLKRGKELKLPSYKSVCRTRRKAQAEHKELKATLSTQIEREESEFAYRSFAKE